MRNTTYLIGVQVTSTAISFLITPFILHSLGLHLFGLWAFLAAAVGFASLVNIGLGRGTVRFVAMFAEHGELETVRRITAYGVLSHLVFGLAFTPVAWYLAPWVVGLANMPASEQDLARNVFFLTFLVFVLGSTVRPLGKLLIGLEQMWITSVIEPGRPGLVRRGRRRRARKRGGPLRARSRRFR